MASLPQETPQEDIRNAMAIIATLHTIAPALAGGIAYELSVENRRAIMARLRSAVVKLEAIARARCPRCHGSDMVPAPNQAGNRETCPACGWSRPRP